MQEFKLNSSERIYNRYQLIINACSKLKRVADLKM